MADTQTAATDDDFDDLDKPVIRRKRSKTPLILAVLLLLLLAGGGVAAFLWFQGMLPQLDPVVEQATDLVGGNSVDPAMSLVETPLEPMIFTLMQRGGRRYHLMVDAVVVSRGMAESIELQRHLPTVRNVMNTHLREIRLDDLRERGSMDDLRQEIRDRLNAALGTRAKVEEVLFREVNIQQ